VLDALAAFRGLPHRMAPIADAAGVLYVDDSKGTTVAATQVALEGLGRPVVLIAGGDGKGQDFSPLAEPVARHARMVLLIGRDAAAIRAALADTGVELLSCDTLEQAVERAGALAQAGQAVLLSPACASMDMFRNYAHRAEVFVDAVRELALARGEVIA
jgi:UDP-N-acetylmuramoylalanine--D-glutamate ligase